LFRIWSPEYGNEPLVFRNVENFFTFWGTINFSRFTLLHGVNYLFPILKLHYCD
jgi:hypothetical protein